VQSKLRTQRFISGDQPFGLGGVKQCGSRSDNKGDRKNHDEWSWHQ